MLSSMLPEMPVVQAPVLQTDRLRMPNGVLRIQVDVLRCL